MKKKYLIILSLVVCLTMTSCKYNKLDTGGSQTSGKSKLGIFSRRDKKEIEEVKKQVRDYLDNYLEGNYEECYKLLSSKEKEVMLLDEFKPQDIDTGDADYDNIVKKINSIREEYSSYIINNVFKVEDHYEVDVSQKIVNEIELFNQIAMPMNIAASLDLLKEIESSDQIPIIENEIRMKVVKEGSEFKIDLGRHDRLKKAKEELMDYGEYIEIVDEKLDRYDDSAYIAGSLKNYGEKNIDYIMLGIKYLDDEGNILYEEIGTSYMGQVDKSVIMKPNYISAFIFSVPERILTDWNNDYELEIIGLSLLDEDKEDASANEIDIDRSIEEKIDIDYDIDIYDDNAYISGKITNNSDEKVKSLILKIYYMDKKDNAILEDLARVYLKDSNYSKIEIPSGSEGDYILSVPDNVLKFWGENIRVEIIELEL